MSELENLVRKYDHDGKIPLPEGAFAVHPLASELAIMGKTYSVLNSYVGFSVSKSVFASTGNIIKPYAREDLGEISDAIKCYGLSLDYPEYNLKKEELDAITDEMQPYIRQRLIRSEMISYYIPKKAKIVISSNQSMVQEGFETGKLILNYIPYGVDFSGDLIVARNLFSGKKEDGKKFLIELDGFSSICKSVNLMNPPELFWLCRDSGKGEDNLKMSGETIVRSILSKPNRDEEVWFYPYYEVPITSKRSIMKRQKILYVDKQKPSAFRLKIDILEHRFPFESSGALFYDGVYGNEVDRVYSHSDFDSNDTSRREVNRETKVIRTIDLRQSPPSIDIYEPKINNSVIKPPLQANPDYKRWAIVGGLLGTITSFWEGQPWWYLTAALAAAVSISVAYLKTAYINSDSMRKANEERKKIEESNIAEKAKRIESFNKNQKRIIDALEAPLTTFNNYDVWSKNIAELEEMKNFSTIGGEPAALIDSEYFYQVISGKRPAEDAGQNQMEYSGPHFPGGGLSEEGGETEEFDNFPGENSDKEKPLVLEIAVQRGIETKEYPTKCIPGKECAGSCEQKISCAQYYQRTENDSLFYPRRQTRELIEFAEKGTVCGKRAWKKEGKSEEK
ncbi:MAG: hypothetical protein ABR985_14710 [Methanotrichaceae archaeon]